MAEWLCTGTLIAPNVVLTSANCVDQSKNKVARVSFTGDEKGLTNRAYVNAEYRKGIKVKNFYVNNDYESLL